MKLVGAIAAGQKVLPDSTKQDFPLDVTWPEYPYEDEITAEPVVAA